MRYRMVILYILCTIAIIIFLALLPSKYQYNSEAQVTYEKKACWVSYQDISNYLKDKNEEEFKAALSNIYDDIIKNEMNTVIMHVRAMGDAIYPSSYYPWSTYITSNRAALDYDPLKIMVDMAHEKGLKFEAWINPYRLSLSNTTTSDFKSTAYYAKYSDLIIEYENSGGEICLVFDPSKQGARDIISNGVIEIVSNYNIDAIHFDDYFYVDGMAPDLPIEDKKHNVNLLISQVYSSIKTHNSKCEFGISPAGNLSNARAQGADIDTWMSSEGYIDYIMPQIYWSDTYQTSDGIQTMYTNRCREWQEINKRDIPIYVGLALYRVGEKNDTDLGWYNSNENLLNQYIIAHELGYDGYSLFRYEWLNMPVAQDELNNLNNHIRVLQYKCPANIYSYVSYITEVEEYGWQTVKTDGVISGTTNEGVSLKAIGISLGNKITDSGITYRLYSDKKQWHDWVSDGIIANIKDSSIYAIQIKLTGNAQSKYDIYYRVNVQNKGWMNWSKNGETAGEKAVSEPIDAIQIRLVERN